MSDELHSVMIVRFGTRRTTKGDVYLNYSMYGAADESIEMAYYFWVIQSADQSILVDTGFSTAGGAARKRISELDVEVAFREVGLTQSSPVSIVVTHAHYDHIGNLRSFPNSQVVIAASEVEFWSSELSGRAQFARSVEEEEVDYLLGLEARGKLTTYTDRLTLAPGVELLEVGGHTAGQTIVLVETAEGRVILASDAVHFYEEYEADRPYAFVSDLPRTYLAYDLIRSLLDERPGLLVSGHDISVLDRFTAVTDGPLAGFASRIG